MRDENIDNSIYDYILDFMQYQHQTREDFLTVSILYELARIADALEAGLEE